MNKKSLLFFLIIFVLIVNIKTILRYFYPIKYDNYIIKYSAKYNVDPLLVFSLIKAESNFKENAVSRKGAVGLMQITPQTGEYIADLLGEKDFKIENLFNPETNVKFGVFYLSKLSRDFGGNIDNILAAYNAGEGNVRKWLKERQNILKIEELPFYETRIYVKKVKLNYIKYRWLYDKEY